MKKKNGLFYAILASMLWAIVSPFIKTGLSYDMTPMNFAGLRFTSVGIILLIYTWHKGMFKEIKKYFNLIALLSIVNIFIGYAVFYMGVDLVPAAISSIIMGTSPFVNIILTHFMISDDRLNRHKIISILISALGVALILGIKKGEFTLGFMGLVGIGLLYLNIMLQGYSAIKLSQSHAEIDPIFLNGVQMFTGGLMLYFSGVAIEGYHNFIGLPINFYISLGILVIVSTFGFSFWFMALQDKDTKVSEINMCRLIQPLLGAILSWIMMANESPTINSVGGMIIIIFSLVYYFKGKEYMAKLGIIKNIDNVSVDENIEDLQK